MKVHFSEEQEAYRKEAREWLRKQVPHGWDRFSNTNDAAKIQWEWDKMLFEGGYAGISWPKEYGGQGLTWVEEMIFNEEKAKANAPDGLNGIGKRLLGPTLLSYGTEAQKTRFLPPLLSAEEIWCQCYSEPNAGSDLAALSTRAESVGDEWVINGQKIWTSAAQFAHWAFVLARTDLNAPKHKGITYFLVPMNAPGITVKPIKQMNRNTKFNEVYFENVLIPKDSLVGEVNKGWQVAMTTLTFERGTSYIPKYVKFMQEFLALLQLSNDLRDVETGEEKIKQSFYQQKLAMSYIDFSILRYHGLNAVSQLMSTGQLGPEVSLLKLFTSESHQRFAELAMELEEDQANYWGGDGIAYGKFQQLYLLSRAETIFAGTSQIQRNILAERILDMPK